MTKKKKNKFITKKPEPKKETLFWAIILCALVLRLAYFLQIKDNFLFQAPILDAKYYHDWALEILQGDLIGRARGVFMMSPGYSYILAFIYWVLGTKAAVVALIQFGSGIFSGVLVYLTGKKLFSKQAALIGMALYLFYAPALFFESTLLKTSFINLFNLLSIFFTVLSGPVNLLIAGAFIGVSTHLRPNALMLVPIFILWIILSKKQLLRGILMFLAGLAVILMPVAVRNYMVGKEFVVATAHGGMNFYTGNSQFCLGPYTPMPFARTDPAVEQQDFLEQAKRLSGKNLTHAESSAFWMNEAFRFIKANPFDWAKLIYRKVLIFTNDYEPPINLDYYFFKTEYGSILSSLPVSFGVIFPVAMIGLIFGGFNLLLSGYLFVYFISGVIFFVVSEYRFPIVPVMCLYAGLGITILFQKFKDYKIRELFTIIGLLVFFAFLSNHDIYSYAFGFNSYKKSHLSNSYFGMGVTFEEKGMIADAKRSYEKAIRIMPQTAPFINLASIYEKENDLDMALKLNEDALRVYPGSPEAYNNIGAILYKRHNYKQAVECFKQALINKPDFAEAKKNLEVAQRSLK